MFDDQAELTNERTFIDYHDERCGGSIEADDDADEVKIGGNYHDIASCSDCDWEVLV